MGLKILHSADWHLDSPFASLPEEAARMLRQAQSRLPGMAAELARREQCDLTLLAGDIFDRTPSRAALESLKQALEAMRVPVFIAPGNHDNVSAVPWREERWPENVHLFTGDLSYYDLEELDCRVYGAGYQSMDCPALLEGFQARGDARWCVAVLHGDPLSLSSPCCPVTAAQARESGLDYLALGHIHRAGSFRAGNTLCAWPGCPMGRGWDETGPKSVYLVTLEEGAELTPVPLPLPRFYDLNVRIGDNAQAALEAVLPPVQSRDFYRVTLTGSGEVELPALQERFAHLAYLELCDDTLHADPWALAGDDSLRGVFFRMLREQLDGADEARAALIRQAAELSLGLLEDREVTLP